MKQQTIIFTEQDNITDEPSIWYCAKMTWYYLRLFLKKATHDIDTMVHKHAWIVFSFVVLFSFMASYICIYSARAERDRACQSLYKAEQQMKSLKCQLEIENGQGH